MMKTTNPTSLQWSCWLRLLPVISSLLAGCSALNIGENQYGCSGRPQGVQCWSARQVYDATHHGQQPQPKQAVFSRPSASSAAAIRSGGVIDVPLKILPTLTGPVPLRTPSRVMRIGIAPWIDEQGDLMGPSVVYTEIEARRWQIGQPAMQPAPILRPLTPAQPAVPPPSDSNASVGGHPQ